MRKIDWVTVLIWLFVVLMAVLLIVVIIAQIRADIAILMSDKIPFWLKWKLIRMN